MAWINQVTHQQAGVPGTDVWQDGATGYETSCRHIQIFLPVMSEEYARYISM
jgi:hypothetical protein